MALVKVTVTCPHCKVDHEEYDATQYDDKEYYLAYWNIPFNTPEAEEAWQAKLSMTPKEAAMVMSDITIGASLGVILSFACHASSASGVLNGKFQ